MIRQILGFLDSAPWPLVVAVVFLVSALETAIFLGLVLPGELAVMVGGALASRGRVPLAGVVAAGILGPILGDSVGYFIGRRYGRRFFRGRRRERWSRARLWLRRRGASAVFVGRFTAFLRSIIPAAAGAARVPLARFAPWCIAAGVIWGGGSALLGYFLARNFQALEKIASRFSLTILAVVVVGVGASILWSRRKGRRKRRHKRPRSKAAPSPRHRKSA
ncbi:MAG TPA: DedA family protein [Thermoanaerobaculia bacterium]